MAAGLALTHFIAEVGVTEAGSRDGVLGLGDVLGVLEVAVGGDQQRVVDGAEEDGGGQTLADDGGRGARGLPRVPQTRLPLLPSPS